MYTLCLTQEIEGHFISEKVVESMETIACFTISTKQGKTEIEVVNLN